MQLYYIAFNNNEKKHQLVSRKMTGNDAKISEH